MQNQQVIVNHYAGLAGAQYQCAEIGALAPQQLRLKLLAASINPSDLLTIRGTYQARLQLPFVAGYEAVTEIVAIGEYCSPQWQLGQRVMVIGQIGAWQQYRDIAPEFCYLLPDDLPIAVAATSYINPMTAWVMLQQQPLPKNAKVIVTAAASAIGRMLLTLLNQQGIAPTAIVRRAESVPALQSYQLQQILITEQPDFAVKLQQLQQQVSLVLDCVGGELAYQLSQTLQLHGSYLLYGLLSGQPVPAKFWQQRPDIGYQHFHLRQWLQQASRDEIETVIAAISDQLRQGLLRTEIAQSLPLSQIGEALAAAAKLRRGAKILLTA